MVKKFKNNVDEDTYTLEDRLRDLQDEERTPFVLHDFHVEVEDGEPLEHSEVHGDCWEAMFVDGVGKIVPMLPQLIQESHTPDHCIRKAQDNIPFAALMLWPDYVPSGIGSIVAQNPQTDQTEYISSFPIFAGAKVTLRVKDTYPWGNQLEGEVTAITEEDREIPFFDYFFLKNGSLYIPGEQYTFTLAALAYSLEPATDQSVRVGEGNGLYDEEKQKFLDGCPNKTAHDFPAEIVISFRGARLLAPHANCASRYEFRTSILTVEFIKLAEEPLYKFGVVLCGDGGGLPCCLYASEHVLNDYTPKVGDDVQGVLWLSGCLASELQDE